MALNYAHYYHYCHLQLSAVATLWIPAKSLRALAVVAAFQSKVLRHMKGATEELFVKVTYYKNLKRVMVRDGMCGASVEALKNRCSHFKLVPCWF